MSCARPVILGVDGQARTILEESRAGVVIEPENVAELVKAVRHLAANPDSAAQMGANGREYIVRKFSRRQTAAKYIAVLEDLLQAPDRRDARVAA